MTKDESAFLVSMADELAKALDAIREGKGDPLASIESIEADVRIVALGHMPWQEGQDGS